MVFLILNTHTHTHTPMHTPVADILSELATFHTSPPPPYVFNYTMRASGDVNSNVQIMDAPVVCRHATKNAVHEAKSNCSVQLEKANERISGHQAAMTQATHALKRAQARMDALNAFSSSPGDVVNVSVHVCVCVRLSDFCKM
jgi:hypothetical protein